VVGGAGLLGTSICEALDLHGGGVVCLDIVEPGFNPASSDIKFKKLDVSKESEIILAAKDLQQRGDTVDVLVNCAAVSVGKLPEETTADDWERSLRVNLTAAFVLTREFGRMMCDQRSGSIIHFGSIHGMVAPDPEMYPPPIQPNPVDYGAAKAGICQMVRYFAVRWARYGVRVNAITPGPFPKPQVQEHTEVLTKLTRKVPLGRVGQPHEIAGPVIFLAGDASSFVTGHNLVVDGGWTAT